jgi:hypothetical protein
VPALRFSISGTVAPDLAERASSLRECPRWAFPIMSLKLSSRSMLIAMDFKKVTIISRGFFVNFQTTYKMGES